MASKHFKLLLDDEKTEGETVLIFSLRKGIDVTLEKER